jgi:hypothetical protein
MAARVEPVLSGLPALRVASVQDQGDPQRQLSSLSGPLSSPGLTRRSAPPTIVIAGRTGDPAIARSPAPPHAGGVHANESRATRFDLRTRIAELDSTKSGPGMTLRVVRHLCSARSADRHWVEPVHDDRTLCLGALLELARLAIGEG